MHPVQKAQIGSLYLENGAIVIFTFFNPLKSHLMSTHAETSVVNLHSRIKTLPTELEHIHQPGFCGFTKTKNIKLSFRVITILKTIWEVLNFVQLSTLFNEHFQFINGILDFLWPSFRSPFNFFLERLIAALSSYSAENLVQTAAYRLYNINLYQTRAFKISRYIFFSFISFKRAILSSILDILKTRTVLDELRRNSVSSVFI